MRWDGNHGLGSFSQANLFERLRESSLDGPEGTQTQRAGIRTGMINGLNQVEAVSLRHSGLKIFELLQYRAIDSANDTTAGGGGSVAFCSGVPDLWRQPIGMPALHRIKRRLNAHCLCWSRRWKSWTLKTCLRNSEPACRVS
jgi:hypothetical protein